MIIYNKTWLDNLKIHHLAEDELNANCITTTELNAIKQKYPVGFYTPGIFIRIGLFILTFIIVGFATGLLSLMISQTRMIDSPGWPLFLGICVYVMLEIAIRQNHYNTGVDNALLWLSAGLITGAFIWFISSLNNNYTYTDSHAFSISIFILLFSSFLTLRFTDMLMGAITCLSFLAAVYFGWQKIGTFGVATLPFMMMLASALIYFAARRFIDHTNTIYYTNCFIIIQLISLITLYMAGNYYIVSELSNELNNNVTVANSSIPFGWFFWGLTICLPFIYLAAGIWKKDIILIRVGLLLVAAAIATFRYYYHVLSAEAALTLGGCILLGAMYGVVKYLKTPKYGFTYADINKADLMNNLKIEALITAEIAGHTPTAPTEPTSRFGGGSFGGGGSSSNY
jgi:uncharacterized membrane protein YgcG